jgi:probable F420-dependent oxidoreductase
MTSAVPTLSIPLANWSADDPGGWQSVFEWAAVAEQAGIDRLAVSDHVVFGEDLGAYGRPELGGSLGGRQPTGPDGHWLEPLTLLAMIAARTTTIRLHTGILLAALRRPVVLAKTAATIDVLSGGRLELGVGIGWQREEYEAAGLVFEQRGRLLDETLAICRTLWCDPVSSFHGVSGDFGSIHMMPKPTRAGGVPVWVSGTINDAVLARIVRFGDGWIPWGDAQRDVVAAIALVHSALHAAGRSIDGFEVTGYLRRAKTTAGAIDPQRTMEQVPALVAAGVTDFRFGVDFSQSAAESLDVLSQLAVAFREVTGRTR